MRPTTLKLLVRPKTWLTSFRYAAFVESAVLPGMLKVGDARARSVRRAAVKLPDLGLERFFRRTGLPWYLAAFLLIFLAALEVGALWGIWTSFGPAGAGLSAPRVIIFSIGAALPVLGLGFCLELISAAAVQANRIATSLDLQRFARVVVLHDPEAAPPTGERTYLDLARYAAGLRRRLAAANHQQLSLSREIAAGLARD
jgi:hypothetical protein